MLIGLDIGSSNTKIVLMDEDKNIIEKHLIPSKSDWMNVLENMPLSKVTEIKAVGGGASFIDGDLFNIPVTKVPEFEAVIKGGQYLTGENNCIVVCLGTGTSFSYSSNGIIEHIGGSGIGGGLLDALANYCCKEKDILSFLELAKNGDFSKIDLQIQDISLTDIGSLYADATAANMAKLNFNSSKEDIAIGICNLVFQNVGVMSVIADKKYNTGKAIVVGTLANCEAANKCLSGVEKLFNFKFIVPEDSAYAVAIGALL